MTGRHAKPYGWEEVFRLSLVEAFLHAEMSDIRFLSHRGAHGKPTLERGCSA